MTLYWELLVLSVSIFLLGFYLGTLFEKREVEKLKERIISLRSANIRAQLKDIDYGRR